MKIGDEVRPKTFAGLELADMPADGTYNQKRNPTCIFTGIGRVLKLHNVIIDYDTWSTQYAEQKLGKVKYTNCFIECETGKGWAGLGALKEK